jgi:hypothetical protein
MLEGLMSDVMNGLNVIAIPSIPIWLVVMKHFGT